MHLRNPNKIQPPKRFDDDPNDPTLRGINYTEAREMSCELEEEVYATPTRKKAPRKSGTYHRPLVRFNPYNPPAAFPSMDDISQAPPPPKNYDPGSMVRQYESESPEEAELRWAELKQLASERGFDHARFSRFNSPTLNQSEMPLKAEKSPGPIVRPGYQPLVTVATGDGGLNSTGQPAQENQPTSMWDRNVKLVKKYNEMSYEDLFAKECERSDEEKTTRAPPKSAEAKGDRPNWVGIVPTLQLDIATEVAPLCNYKTDQVWKLLRLTTTEQSELAQLLRQRQDLRKRENANSILLIEETNERLLKGRKAVSQSTYHGMLDQTIFSTVGEEDYKACTTGDFKKAETYLEFCGLDPSLLPWTSSMLTATPMASHPAPFTPRAASSAAARSVMLSPSKGDTTEVPYPGSGRSGVHLAEGAPDSSNRGIDQPYPQDPSNLTVPRYRNHQPRNAQGRANGAVLQPRPNVPIHPPAPHLATVVPIQSTRSTRTASIAPKKASLLFTQEPPYLLPYIPHAESRVVPEHQQGVHILFDYPQCNTQTSIPIRDSTLTPLRGEPANGVLAHPELSSKKRAASECFTQATDGDTVTKRIRSYQVETKGLDASSGFPKNVLASKTTNGQHGHFMPAAPMQKSGFIATDGDLVPAALHQDSTDMSTNGGSCSAPPIQFFYDEHDYQ